MTQRTIPNLYLAQPTSALHNHKGTRTMTPNERIAKLFGYHDPEDRDSQAGNTLTEQAMAISGEAIVAIQVSKSNVI